ncbi:hypothetical protein CPLU01_04337 [Colletotrichum plurivorum]|uniref:Uncharacterized protein n=1 Tax=Colletotrichum plurivorum TaxID=2175906 RepID=A0A8H6KR68_9PEZI|nr:hypothetical protein CPLU01_04337 [Colletotrichum plurivorum]
MQSGDPEVAISGRPQVLSTPLADQNTRTRSAAPRVYKLATAASVIARSAGSHAAGNTPLQGDGQGATDYTRQPVRAFVPRLPSE